MQIHFGKSGSIRPAAAHINDEQGAGQDRAPGLHSRPDAAGLLFPGAGASRAGANARSSQPLFQDHHPTGAATADALSDAMKGALAADDWAALAAAPKAAPDAGQPAELQLMQHAARMGARKIAFRLQSMGADPFAPDAASCPFFIALLHGQEQLAEDMLRYERLVDGKDLPDLAPVLEAAVEGNAGKAIDWLVKFSARNGSDMPFRLFKAAIDQGNARRVEIMGHHPSFAPALSDPVAEDMILRHAIRKSDCAVLTALLARKRSAASVNALCETTDANGDTLLHVAAARGESDKLKLILDFNPGIRREDASDSLFARLMRGNGIDVKNKQGKTARELASDAGHAELAAMLDARGARH